MKKIKIILLLNAALGTAFLSNGQDGETIFGDNCAACHTVGGGRLVGPDLKGVHEKRDEQWLISFIKDSQGLIASGDADAKAIFDEYGGVAMPAQSMSDGEIKAIISFISTKGSAEAVAVDKTEITNEEEEEDAEPVVTTDEASEEDVDAGMKLFTGELTFENGGVACVSCHNVYNDKIIGGGLLAKDLTDVHSRMGDLGISGLLASPPFPSMAESYKNRALTEKEIYQLTSFFNVASKESTSQHPRTWDWVLVFGGGGICFLFLVWIMFAYHNRKTKSTKHDILARQGYYDETK